LISSDINQYGQKVGMSDDKSLSEVIGNLLYSFILLIVIVSALDQLQIEAISGPATEMLNTIINIIPSEPSVSASPFFLKIMSYY
jgi:hypothetical protein